jgi:translation initiation factor 2 beta subunit (eIF-2beta)/eIF-5
MDFLDAVHYLKAKPEEMPINFINEVEHYKHVNNALDKYTREYVEVSDTSSINRKDLDKTSLEANKFLRNIEQITTDNELKSQCIELREYISEGIYAQLPRYLKALSREYKNDRERMKKEEYNIQGKISELIREYQTMSSEQKHDKINLSDPQIIISESFK